MYERILKRGLDLIFAVVLLPIGLTVLIAVSVAIFLDDRGRVFYVAKRLGRFGKTFYMYKFRSMQENAPDIRNKDGSTYNADNDPRLTRVGKLLRKSSIDEIPQLLNIIKGEMSFVGPRPDLPEHGNVYSEFEKRKLMVRPGITGYSQAYFRNSISFHERLKNDVFYVDNISLAFDIRIICKTFVSVLTSKGVFVESDEDS